MIVSYSDIIYVPTVVNSLLASEADISVVVDKDWLQQWQQRMDDPLSDAETLKLSPEGLIVELGKKPTSYDDIAGQYTGLIKFSAKGMAIARKFYHDLDVPGARVEGRAFLDMHMTGFLQAMINAGIPVHPVWISGGWTECDAPEDLLVDLDVSSLPVSLYSSNKTPQLKFNKAEALEKLTSSEECSSGTSCAHSVAIGMIFASALNSWTSACISKSERKTHSAQ